MANANLRLTIKTAVQESYKKTKKEVDYSKGMRKSRCGVCKYFIPDDGECEKVKGSISEDMWCKLFKPEYER
jgi:hypothetical protein